MKGIKNATDSIVWSRMVAFEMVSINEILH